LTHNTLIELQLPNVLGEFVIIKDFMNVNSRTGELFW